MGYYPPSENIQRKGKRLLSLRTQVPTLLCFTTCYQVILRATNSLYHFETISSKHLWLTINRSIFSVGEEGFFGWKSKVSSG
jgi:hypothetical protein